MSYSRNKDFIPTKLRIAGYDYAVNRSDESFACGNDVCDGVHKTCDHQIVIAKRGDVQYQQTVFLHEMIHALIECYCPGLSDEDNEKVCETLSKGLYQVIRDNSEVFVNLGKTANGG